MDLDLARTLRAFAGALECALLDVAVNNNAKQHREETNPMRQKHLIQVHSKGEHYGTPGPHIATIKRVLRAEQIGNFNPIFCTYKNKRHLVQSLEGDLSDPFRRDETYLQTLYIEIEETTL